VYKGSLFSSGFIICRAVTLVPAAETNFGISTLYLVVGNDIFRGLCSAFEDDGDD
jgi:hypothetical protein